MDLERRIGRIKNVGKSLLLGTFLLGVTYFGGCEKKVVNSHPEETPPDAPEISSVIPTTNKPNRGMIIQIKDNSNNEKLFSLQRKTPGGTFELVDLLPPNAEKYVDWKNIETNTIYTYRIRANNEEGNSSWSEEKSGTSTGPVTDQISLYPTADSYVRNGTPNANEGKEKYIIISYFNGGEQKQEAYIKFDYTQIPPYAISIKSASLRLFSVDHGAGSQYSQDVYAEDLADGWYESSVTWNNRPYGRGGIIEHAYVYSIEDKPVTWDITYFVNQFFEGTTLNHGIKLASKKDGMAILKSRESNSKPTLTINYTW